MDSYMDYYPFDDRKDDSFYLKKNLKSMSKKNQKLGQKIKNEVLILKTNTDKESKYNRRVMNLKEDELCFDVPYSMNRKYRFNQLTPYSITASALSDGENVGVLEQWSLSKGKTELASAYHEVTDNGDIIVRSAHHIAASAKTLMEKPKPKRKIRKSIKSCDSQRECEEAEQHQPPCLYTISKCHPVATMWKIPSSKTPKVRVRKRALRIVVGSGECDISDWEAGSDGEDVWDENSYNSGFRERQFNLGDFMQQPIEKHSEEIEVKKFDDSAESQTVTGGAFELIEFPREVREAFHFIINVRTKYWQGFDFEKEAEELFKSIANNCEFNWITRNKGMFCVSLFDSDSTQPEKLELFPLLNMIFEFPVDGLMKVRLEGSFKLKEESHRIKSQLFDSKPKTVRDLVDGIIKCVTRWKNEFNFSKISKFCALRVPSGTTVPEESIADYHSSLYSSMLLGELNIIEDTAASSLLIEKYKMLMDAEESDFEDLCQEERCCTVCSCKVRSGMTSLWCLHDVCGDCLRESIIAQLRMDIFPPTCCSQFCDSPIPLRLLFTLLPVPLYIYFIRRSLYHTGKSKGDQIGYCPVCLGYGSVKIKPYKTVKCTACSSCFCLNCGSTPHWPLKCNENSVWITKFEPQHKFEKMRQNGELKVEMITRECFCCKRQMEAGDKVKQQRCRCYLLYDWQTGKYVSHTPDAIFSHSGDGKRIYARDVIAREISRYRPTWQINHQYASLCTEARVGRYDIAEANKFSTMITHHYSVLTPSTRVKLSELRKMILYLMEYGTAWLYFHRHIEDEQWKRVRSSIYKLRKTLQMVTAKVDANTLSEYNKQEIIRNTDELQTASEQLIDIFEVLLRP